MKKALLVLPVLCALLVVWAVVLHLRDIAPIPAYGQAWPSHARRLPGAPPMTVYDFTYHGQPRSLFCPRLAVGTIVLFKETGPGHYSYMFSPSGPVPAGWRAPAGWQRLIVFAAGNHPIYWVEESRSSSLSSSAGASLSKLQLAQ